MSALVTLLLLGLAIACFIGDWLGLELVPLLTAGLLMANAALTPIEALAGFGSLGLGRPGVISFNLQWLAAYGISQQRCFQRLMTDLGGDINSLLIFNCEITFVRVSAESMD